MRDLDAKTTAVFAGKVVRKDLVRKVKVGANVPVFVLEYLLGKYCATEDPAAIDAGLRVPLLPPILSAWTKPTKPSPWSKTRASTPLSTR
jgi:predicted ATP-dependent Lon-type protease